MDSKQTLIGEVARAKAEAQYLISCLEGVESAYHLSMDEPSIEVHMAVEDAIRQYGYQVSTQLKLAVDLTAAWRTAVEQAVS